MIESVILLANVVLVLVMTGGVWLRQLIYYPLYAFVGEDRFAAYQRENRHRVARSLQPAQILTVLAALLLVFIHPSAIPIALPLAGVTAEALVVAATAYEVPRQRRLEGGFAADLHRQLLAGNWVRTLGLSVHTAIVIWMLTLVTRG